ncbi:MAG: Rid family detoxifying hydrolase [Halobacteriales archaeon]
MREVIETDAAPAAVGAYSQAIATEELVFTAGQIPLTPAGELLDDASIEDQTERALENVAAVLEAAGSGLEEAIKVTVMLDDIADFEAMNAVYASYFEDDPPARSAFEVGSLPKGASVEIEAVARRP